MQKRGGYLSIEFKDNREAVLKAMETAKKKALTAIGLAAVEITTDYMQSRYGKPIRQTGDLMRDVNFKVRTDNDAVDVGNDLEYAPWVHGGTAKVPARPYLYDAITENTDVWEEIAEEHLSNGFK